MFDKTLNKLPIPTWLRRALTSPAGELGRGQRALKYSVELGRHCAGELRHDKAGQMAAALTYHTLFSMLPTMVLILVSLKAFVSEQDREHFKEQAITWVVNALQGQDQMPKNEAGEPIAVPVEPSPQADDPEAIAASIEKRSEFQTVRGKLDETFSSVINSLEQINFASIGVVGVLVFLYGATGLLGTIEKSFNSIFGVAYGRSLHVRFPLYFTTLVLGPLVLLAGQYLQSEFINLLSTSGSWVNWAVGPAVVLAPLVTMWLVLYLMYLLMPNTSVSKHGAAIGSIVASIGLLLVREGFRWYVGHAAIASLYGALALLPLFLMFVWLTWLIVLFGLELTYTLGAMKGRKFKRQRNQEQEQIIDPTWMVPLASLIAEAFVRGGSCTVDELQKATSLPGRALRRMLSALERAGIIHTVGARDDTIRFSLARPAERVRLADVIDSAHTIFPEINRPQGHHAAWNVVGQLREAELEMARSKTLADLVNEDAESANS
ncbi:YihY family inner membrane protein [Planctomycetales bacterium ZRK34]|nr:YihY family inner membrane protein [Planctomycetales bacterium ZRK34]